MIMTQETTQTVDYESIVSDFSIFMHLGFPREILYALLVVGVIGFGYVMIGRKPMEWYSLLLLALYIIALLCKTVVYRPHTVPNFEVYPFWSYIEGFRGKTYIIAQNILNIVLFVPIGFLVTGVSRKLRWIIVLLIGGALSSTIEFLQQVFEKGVAEFDDVFHNTIGCLLGFLLLKGIQRFFLNDRLE